jgi:hypothetical protein
VPRQANRFDPVKTWLAYKFILLWFLTKAIANFMALFELKKHLLVAFRLQRI